MIRRVLLGLVAAGLLAASVLAWVVIRPVYKLNQEISPETAAADHALQDDDRVDVPAPLPLEPRPYSALKNVYWGELHVHTRESMDAVICFAVWFEWSFNLISGLSRTYI